MIVRKGTLIDVTIVEFARSAPPLEAVVAALTRTPQLGGETWHGHAWLQGLL